MRFFASAIAFGLASLCTSGVHVEASTQKYEREPVLRAVRLVQPALLSGPDFRVVPEVRVRGYMADYLIDTKFGPMYAESTQLLGIRIAELPALEALDRASRTGAFAHAFSTRGKNAGAAIVHVLAHPVDTITGLPAGVARYFEQKWDTWAHRAQSLSDRTTRIIENPGNPSQAPSGPMTAIRRIPPEVKPPGHRNRTWYGRMGSEAGRETRRYLKFNQQRRAICKLLGIDPNSTNAALKEKLDSLAWAAVWGDFSATAALGKITGTTAQVVSYSAQVNRYVYDYPPEQLREINARRLQTWCSDDYSIRQFLHRGGFTDTLRSKLIDKLAQLNPVRGCNELIELGASTRGEVEARYLVNALSLILDHAPESGGGTLMTVGAALAYRTRSGKLILPLPVDYLSWNRHLARFLDLPDWRNGDKTVLIGGEASLLSQRNLTQRGWNLVIRARYRDAPAYATIGEFDPRREQERLRQIDVPDAYLIIPDQLTRGSRIRR